MYAGGAEKGHAYSITPAFAQLVALSLRIIVRVTLNGNDDGPVSLLEFFREFVFKELLRTQGKHDTCHFLNQSGHLSGSIHRGSQPVGTRV